MSYRSTWDPLSQGVRWRLAAGQTGQTHTTLQIVNLIIIVIVMDPRWSPASQLCCGCYLQLNCLHLDIHLDPAAHRHSVLILYWQNIILEEFSKLFLVTTDHSMLTCPRCSVQLYSAPRVRAGGTCHTQLYGVMNMSRVTCQGTCHQCDPSLVISRTELHSTIHYKL